MASAKRWEHCCSQAWLDARKPYITASEIASLIPTYKRIKAGKENLFSSPALIKLYGQKHSAEPDDPMSYGAAARGHIMEPWAIEEYNKHASEKLFHWDDVVVVNGKMGYSPDAMDIPQPAIGPIAPCQVLDGVTHIGEAKCYEPGKHMQAAMQNPMRMDERWQVAMAMSVMPKIESADLILYCPPLSSIKLKRFTREMLDKEMKTIEEIVVMYENLESFIDANFLLTVGMATEFEIYSEYEKLKPGALQL